MTTSKHFLPAIAIATACVVASPISWAQEPQVQAPVVKSIDVQFAGPATVSKERILNNMRTKVGKPYSVGIAEEDVRNLYKTAKVYNVRIFGDRQPGENAVKVIVVVQTKSTVEQVNIEGATQIKPHTLLKKLATKKGAELSESDVEADRQKILTAYQDKGYKDTDVKTQIKTNEKTSKSDVTFVIAEAGKTIVKRVQFEGNTVFTAKQLRKVVKTRSHYLFSFIDKSGRVENDVIAADVEALRAYYQNHGYEDVKIGDPTLTRTEGKDRVIVTFSIEEGPQYHVGSVTVGGARLFSAAEIGGALQQKEGVVYSPAAVHADIKRIQDIYGTKGYVDADVTPVISPMSGCRMSLTYRIEEGSQSYIERVNISGNTRTKDKVIRRELAVGPGELYNTVAADVSKQRLQNLNYFNRVDIFPSDTMVPGRKDMNVVVDEKKTGSLNFGAGYSTIDGVLGFAELSQNNFDITNWPDFTGGGERFRARAQIGTERKDITIGLTEPYFLDYQLAVGGEVYYREADYLSDVYDQRNYGFDVFTRKAITQNLSWRLEYRLEEIDLYNMADNVSDIMRQDDGSHLKSQISPSLIYDTRDSLFLTRRGDRVELSGYVAGGPLGGNDSIYGGDLQASHYMSLPWDTILTLTGEVAAVNNWDGSDHVPIFDALYLGGSNNLRGFKFRDVGPKDNYDEPIGGDSMARATVEYTYPIIDRVRGAVFYDVGYVNASAGDFSPDNVASDAGIGLRLDLPIGPIRIDYGYPVTHGDSTDHSGHFNFNIGYQF